MGRKRQLGKSEAIASLHTKTLDVGRWRNLAATRERKKERLAGGQGVGVRMVGRGGEEGGAGASYDDTETLRNSRLQARGYRH